VTHVHRLAVAAALGLVAGFAAARASSPLPPLDPPPGEGPTPATAAASRAPLPYSAAEGPASPEHARLLAVFGDVPTLRARADALQDTVEDLLGEPPDWLEHFPSEHRADSFRAALDGEIPGMPEGIVLADVACPPEPCLVVLRARTEPPDEHHGPSPEDRRRLLAAEEAVAGVLGFPRTAHERGLWTTDSAGQSVHYTQLWWMPPGIEGTDWAGVVTDEVAARVQRNLFSVDRADAFAPAATP